uniref:Uncharacterized protein n=1 Tax=Cacopsylla melanoneura TaxID=428564 RepID=A0A8D9BDJ4_9HEMI
MLKLHQRKCYEDSLNLFPHLMSQIMQPSALRIFGPIYYFLRTLFHRKHLLMPMFTIRKRDCNIIIPNVLLTSLHLLLFTQFHHQHHRVSTEISGSISMTLQSF